MSLIDTAIDDNDVNANAGVGIIFEGAILLVSMNEAKEALQVRRFFTVVETTEYQESRDTKM